MHRQIAGRLTGPVTKWLVLAFWILLAVGSSFLAQKLADVQNNEASSWLPASAESTKALDKLEPFQDPNLIPTLVVYEREGGPHRGRHRRRQRRRRRVPGDGRCRGRRPRPDAVRGRRGHADAGQLQLRHGRLERHARRRRRAARDRARERRPQRAHRGRRWPGRRRRRGVRGHRHDPAVRDARRGDPDPAVHLPQPGAVDPADLLCRHRAVLLPGADLPAGEVRRPDRQRPELRDPHHPGHRRRHRLRAAAGGALSRGATPSRGPARGDGVRPAPGRAGHRGERGHRDARHAVPDVRGDELHPPASARWPRSASASPCW